MIKMTLNTGPEAYLSRAPHVGERRTGYLDPSSARPSYMVKKKHRDQSLEATKKPSSNEVSALQLLGKKAQWETHMNRTMVFSVCEEQAPLNKMSYFKMKKLIDCAMTHKAHPAHKRNDKHSLEMDSL